MNTEYHKIQTFFRRDPVKDFKEVILGEYATPEFEYLAYSDWEWSEKYDGMNIRVIFDGNSVRFGGKTDAAQIPAGLFARLAEEFTLDRLRRVFDVTRLNSECPAVLYGEGVGAGIQKEGHRYGPTQSFVLFDVAVGGIFLHGIDWETIVQGLDINSTQVMGIGNMWEAVLFVLGRPDMEGVVCRPRRELCDRFGRRIITKLKYKDFPHSV